MTKNHRRGFTWKRVVELGRYMDEDGKINRLPAKYEGDFDLGSGKGERLIILHFSKLEYIHHGLIWFSLHDQMSPC